MTADEEKESEIASFLESMGDRVSVDRQGDVTDYLDHGEWALAVDILGYGLLENGSTLSPPEQVRFSAIVESVGHSPASYQYLGLS